MEAAKTFCQNKDGKWVIGQFPNIPIAIWATLTVLVVLMPDSSLREHLDALRTAVLFTWAYLELAYGDSKFRQMLGFIVLAVVVYGIFAS